MIKMHMICKAYSIYYLVLHSQSVLTLDTRTARWNFQCFAFIEVLFVVQLLSRVQLFVTPWTAAHQASLSFTISWSLLKFTSIESMPSIFPRIRSFSIVAKSCPTLSDPINCSSPVFRSLIISECAQTGVH